MECEALNYLLTMFLLEHLGNPTTPRTVQSAARDKVGPEFISKDSS